MTKNFNILEKLGIERSMVAPFWAVVCNILFIYVIFTILRCEYLLENFSYFKPSIDAGHLWTLMKGGIILDTPGIFYFNLLYIVMMLLPLHYKENQRYYAVCHIVFVILNGIAIVISMADSVYFTYTLRRTTWDIFHEFSNEDNTAKVVGIELIRHWYLVVLDIILIWILCKFYATPKPGANTRPRLLYYLLTFLSLAIAMTTAISGIRGGLLNHWWQYLIAMLIAYAGWCIYKSDIRDKENNKKYNKMRKPAMIVCFLAAIALVATAPAGKFRHRDIRPLSIASASKYAERPIDCALVLNTPFTMVRTIGNAPFKHPEYYSDPNLLASIYNPEHQPLKRAAGEVAPGEGKNVVIIILESFGKEYIGSLNKDIIGKDYKGYTPFLDSLISHSAVWHYSFDNGQKSIDAMPGVLTSIPSFERPFVLTGAAMNKMEGIPAQLAKKGYTTAFFHGARTGSMGFDSFANSIGFEKYYGMEDFNKDGLVSGKDSFDGYWGIWDELFLQYYALKMSTLKPPFMTALFTLSSHHPFQVPKQYEKRFPRDEKNPITHTILFSDNALRNFFNTARKQPWFENTIFVITNDHTNQRLHEVYKNEVTAFYGPIIIYDPSGEITPGERRGIAQQIDIMPTLMNYLGVYNPYLAFGKDLLNTPEEDMWAVNFINGTYQYIKYGYIFRFDGEKETGLYRLDDIEMKRDIKGSAPKIEKQMERELKALLQQYMDRMIDNRLTPD